MVFRLYTYVREFSLPHRARAAFCAISLSRSGVSFLARASPALLGTKFAQGDGGGVLLGGRLLGWFLRQSVVSQRLTRGLFHNGSGKLADIGGLEFLLVRLGIMMPLCHGIGQIASASMAYRSYAQRGFL
jgi:hypothetical protein